MSWHGATDSDLGLGQRGDHDDGWSGQDPCCPAQQGVSQAGALGPSHGPRLRVRADSGGAWKPVGSLLEPVFEGLQAEC